MRNILFLIAFISCAIHSIPVNTQTRPGHEGDDMFLDVAPHHWTYIFMEYLHSQNIIVGYPDAYFRGKRTLTRYEMAVGLDRALKFVYSTGSDYRVPPTGSLTPWNIVVLRLLIVEFKNEMSSLGNNMAAIQKSLHTLQALSGMELMFHHPVTIDMPRRIARQQYRKLNPSAYKPSIGPYGPGSSRRWVKQ